MLLTLGKGTHSNEPTDKTAKGDTANGQSTLLADKTVTMTITDKLDDELNPEAGTVTRNADSANDDIELGTLPKTDSRNGTVGLEVDAASGSDVETRRGEGDYQQDAPPKDSKQDEDAPSRPDDVKAIGRRINVLPAEGSADDQLIENKDLLNTVDQHEMENLTGKTVDKDKSNSVTITQL